ncbi:modification methylase [candidate division MSBL1 archaeon SCGC-AAA382A20]|uniref:Type II methyltransferase n=1 Tax=candidate division MSBL1 archaeon SCGC-AAA382A20 TaxID=1698280 RepID=A0A133VMA8_9EURY|nr:modification methylase [candidate division MSBL1 archaeon SCGC-AAA382A20]
MAEKYRNEIFNRDCIEGMRDTLPDCSIDVIVTSPPYNIGVEYGNYSDDVPFKTYVEMMGGLTEECYRVLKDDGSFFLNIGDQPSDDMRSLKVGLQVAEKFCVQNTIHWVKSIAIPEKEINIGHYKPVNSPRYLNNPHEYIFHFTKNEDVELDKLAIGVPYQDKSNIGRWKHARQDLRDRGNVWFIPYDTVVSAKQHPAAFPPKLAEMCLQLHGVGHSSRASTDPALAGRTSNGGVSRSQDGNMVVLDPFMGIGSTAIAARKLGIDYVGFEIDPGYVQMAEEHVKNQQKRLWS